MGIKGWDLEDQGGAKCDGLQGLFTKGWGVEGKKKQIHQLAAGTTFPGKAMATTIIRYCGKYCC